MGFGCVYFGGKIRQLKRFRKIKTKKNTRADGQSQLQCLSDLDFAVSKNNRANHLF